MPPYSLGFIMKSLRISCQLFLYHTTSGNVTPEDKEALEQAKEDLEQALQEFGDNYTDEEKAGLEADNSRIEEALDVIERVEDTEDAIGALPDTVNPNDGEAVEQIQAVKDLYDDLNDYEKSLISTEAKDKLESLLAALCDYSKTEGGNGDKTANDAARSPQTGDNTNIALWMALLLASGAGISAAEILRRKRRTKTK